MIVSSCLLLLGSACSSRSWCGHFAFYTGGLPFLDLCQWGHAAGFVWLRMALYDLRSSGQHVLTVCVTTFCADHMFHCNLWNSSAGDDLFKCTDPSFPNPSSLQIDEVKWCKMKIPAGSDIGNVGKYGLPLCPTRRVHAIRTRCPWASGHQV